MTLHEPAEDYMATTGLRGWVISRSCQQDRHQHADEDRDDKHTDDERQPRALPLLLLRLRQREAVSRYLDADVCSASHT